MSEEIGLKERTGSAPAPPSESETEADPTPVVEAPLPGLPQAPSPIRRAPVEMSLVQYLDEPLYRARGWIQLMGILFLLHGVLMALSFVGTILSSLPIWLGLPLSLAGIIPCWLPIWLGLTLVSAAKNIRAAADFNDQKFLRLALDKIGLFFKINGVLIVIGLVVGILAGVAVVLGVLGSASMMSQGMQNMMQ